MARARGSKPILTVCFYSAQPKFGQVTDQLLIDLQQSPLMCIHLRDINVKNCDMTSNSLRYLNWAKLENVNIIGTRIEGKKEALIASSHRAGCVLVDTDHFTWHFKNNNFQT